MHMDNNGKRVVTGLLEHGTSCVISALIVPRLEGLTNFIVSLYRRLNNRRPRSKRPKPLWLVVAKAKRRSGQKER